MLQDRALFTGLIEDTGQVGLCKRRGDSVELTIAPRALDLASVVLGESIAVNGVCLTVTQVTSQNFQALAGAETLTRTNLGALRVGNRVNLERALRVGDRLGGHMVQGHVDGVGRITERIDQGANLIVGVRVPGGLERYIIEKGSICIDGISLTVNRVQGTSLRVALIPHSVAETTLANKNAGDSVNLEVDMVAKYIENFQMPYVNQDQKKGPKEGERR